ncbi:hypothetical protein GQ602_004626 [Ophiocordyceps camponoti-floridani]|uniref:Uncharacterized protein n=1 Tax=Ophiocordyceps camponoti-floridani TaxID=2030778 RepID=A0A8H4VDY6_9HYPO|nr:hypothetical protein GQ602_004626 [Ophiocordyceps camponoti-floridani]
MTDDESVSGQHSIRSRFATSCYSKDKIYVIKRERDRFGGKIKRAVLSAENPQKAIDNFETRLVDVSLSTWLASVAT